MISFETQQRVLHESFDIETHKATFVNYLEVMIDPCGTVHYAVPSHQQWLMNRYRDINNCTTEELMDSVPREYYCDIMTWLTKETLCVAVWNDFIIGKPNLFQQRTLESLISAGLYKGEI